MSQTGDFMVEVTPCGLLFESAIIGLNVRILVVTLAHHGHESQAALPRLEG
jgi:hypothetical protein